MDDCLFGDMIVDACNARLCSFLFTFDDIGLSIAKDKIFNATQKFVFSGFSFDTVARLVKLPHD